MWFSTKLGKCHGVPQRAQRLPEQAWEWRLDLIDTEWGYFSSLGHFDLVKCLEPTCGPVNALGLKLEMQTIGLCLKISITCKH